MADCIFCKILEGEIPSKKVYEDEEVFAFHDVNPEAPIHILIIPKKHISKIAEIKANDSPLMGKVLYAAQMIARDQGLEHYRLVNNNGEEAGQSVFHIHFHLMGGRSFAWPPG